MGNPFVTPAVQRLTLSTGDTIDIIKRLNHGETEDMYARFLEKRGSVRTVLILTYLVGWSLTRDGQPVPYGPQLSEQERTDTIRNLDPDVAGRSTPPSRRTKRPRTGSAATQKKRRLGRPHPRRPRHRPPLRMDPPRCPRPQC